MNESDQASLYDSLMDASRALIETRGIDRRDARPQKDAAAARCLLAYGRLLHCQETIPLSPDESANVQRMLDRLQANLKFLGRGGT